MQQFESFAQMQRDAERRVMEMQKRAMAAVETSDPPPVIFSNPPVSGCMDEAKDSPSPEPLPEVSEPSEPSEPSDGSSPVSPPPTEPDAEDAERALLLATLFLVKDHADPRLLFLLLYLLT